jgi:hypothetical protein
MLFMESLHTTEMYDDDDNDIDMELLAKFMEDVFGENMGEDRQPSTDNCSVTTSKR